MLRSSPLGRATCKVLHFRQGSYLSGPEKFILDLCRALPAHGYDCEIAIMYKRAPHEPLEHPMVAAGKAQGTPVTQLDGAWRGLAGSIRRLRRKLLDEGFCLLHCHEYKTDIAGAIAAWGIPRERLRRVATARHTETGWQMGLFQRLDAVALRAFDRITVPSQGALQELAPHPYLLGRVRVVRHAVDAALLRSTAGDGRGIRRSLGVADGEAVISIIARLEPVKRHHDFLEGARRILIRHPGARFWIVGEGSLRQQLEVLTKRLGLSNAVSFLGYRCDVSLVIEASDVVVISSSYESFSRVLMEALTLGKPVVATSVGGIPEVIRHGETGWLVPPGDPERLAEGVLQVLENREWGRQMGSRGSRYVSESCTVEAAAAAMAALYTEVTACRS